MKTYRDLRKQLNEKTIKVKDAVALFDKEYKSEKDAEKELKKVGFMKVKNAKAKNQWFAELASSSERMFVNVVKEGGKVFIQPVN